MNTLCPYKYSLVGLDYHARRFQDRPSCHFCTNEIGIPDQSPFRKRVRGFDLLFVIQAVLQPLFVHQE